jgi:hypothetical protein
MSAQAQALLDAHTTYIANHLSGKELAILIETEVDFLLADAEKITLNEAVTRDMIKDTARGYAVELELSGAIPELVGDIARALYANPIHNFTTVSDVLPDGFFEEFLDKILEMRHLRESIVHEVVANPMYSTLISDITLEGLRDFAQNNAVRAQQLPGATQVARLGKMLLGSSLPVLEEALEDNLHKYIQKSLQGILNRSEEFLLDHFDEEKVRELALDVWDFLKEKRIADLKQGISSLDLEEFFVIGYETWREIRKTAFYGALIDGGIDGFFDKYGDTSLSEIVAEMGVDRDIIMRDAMRFAPPVIAMLKKKNLLKPAIHRHLEGFYQSSAVEKILAGDSSAPPPAKNPITKTIKKITKKAAD